MSLTIDEDEVIEQQKPEDKDKKISYEIGYIIPFWSSKPLHKYSLEVWREGAITNTIEISKKEYYLMGRNKLNCDVYINNITVSRIHCVLQHKDDGDLYIYDLDSVYGTIINKKPIAKKVYTKLHVGDTFKLGQSGKMFIVNGPAELLPEEDEKPLNFVDKKELMRKRTEQVKEQYEQRETYKRSLLGMDKSEADWGQRDFDEEIRKVQKEEEDSDKEKECDYYGPLKFEEIKSRKDLSEKQKNLVEKLENAQKQISKLKDEIIKIHKKEFESGELTDGQRKRVEINEKKLENLHERFELMEDNLRTSLQSKDGFGFAEQKFDKKLLKEINSDEDEFYDRARYSKSGKYGVEKDKDKEKAGKRVDIVTENYETLKSKLEVQMRQRQKLADKLQKFDVENKMKDNAGEEIDALDEYFIETQNKISSEQKNHLTQQIGGLNKDIAK
jgi:pSer/pThr/pTyr-binding forkhead associated (FHA) protein